LKAEQPPRQKKEAKREVRIIQGDFNEKVDDILASGVVTDKEATFALLDQRTFECQWRTVESLARHKTSGNKIELFYFLAVKWLHRSMAGMQVNEHRIAEWWGRDDWPVLKGASQQQICDLVRARFISELGYRYAIPFPIWEKEGGEGSVMYFMIHASDHPAAPGLMWRAYDQAIHPLRQHEQASLPGF
jgi:three-Cys-motif partner protein